MKKTFTLSTIILLFAFSSCNETKKIAKTTSNEIVSGKYEIKQLQDKELSHKLYFEIDTSESRISGKTGCNSFGGNYLVSENEIIISPLTATKMYCEEYVMKVENSIFKAFGKTKTFTFDNNMLTFIDEDGNVTIKAYRAVIASK